MTKAQAMKYVRRMAAAELRHHESNGSEWIYDDALGENRPEEDVKLILEAIEILAKRIEPKKAKPPKTQASDSVK